MNKIEILPSEYNILKQELDIIEHEKEEIRNLWLTANEQWSETFWHDNAILEAKAEKERILAARIQEKGDIWLQIAKCFIIPESDIKERKEQDILIHGEVKGGLGSIYSLKYEGQQRELKWIMTWIVQGKKIEFDGHSYPSFSPTTELWKALFWKSRWEKGSFNIPWKEIIFTILNIE